MTLRLTSILLAITFNACATAQQAIVSSTETFKPDRSTVLNLRLKQVVLVGHSMHGALRRLEDGISSSTDGKISITFGVENSRDPMAKMPLKDPQVRVEASNISLRELLDQLCRQSGWSYREYSKGVMFTDDGRFFTKEPRENRE